MKTNKSTYADTVFVGGAVYTVDAPRRWARAVAVRGGRISAVGTDSLVRGLVGPRTEVIDLRGRMLLPGFQDAHVHASAAGLDRTRVDLSETHSRDEYARLIRKYADSHRNAEWILGSGWSMDLFPGGIANKEELDALVPDRPAFLLNRDAHGAWANSRALELAGVTRNTADPEDGRIERNSDGSPVGTLQEGAMALVEAIVPQPDLEERVRGVVAGQAYLHALGITAWQEAIVGTYPGISDCYDAYLTAAERGHLTGRVVGALWFERGRGDEQLDGFLDRRTKASSGPFQAGAVKIMLDGVCENFTASMLRPYLQPDGSESGNCGKSFFDPELLKGFVTRLDAEGFQVHFHAIGDRAVREALDAVAAARIENGFTDNRHHIAHIQVVHPDDVPRFRALGVVANGQPLWACLDPQMAELTLPFLGPERSAWQYPFGSLVRSGAVLAFGSDWAVSTPDPLQELHVAVNRMAPAGFLYGAESRVFLPDERIDLPTALAAFTAGSAYVNHLDEAGTIEPGKLADLVVLDRNLFEHPVGEISEARVELTMVGGANVFVAPTFDG